MNKKERKNRQRARERKKELFLVLINHTRFGNANIVRSMKGDIRNIITEEELIDLIMSKRISVEGIPDSSLTEPVMKAFIRVQPHNIQHFFHLKVSKEVCDLAMNLDPNMIRFLPENRRTRKYCLQAVLHKYENAIYVPEKFLVNGVYKMKDKDKKIHILPVGSVYGVKIFKYGKCYCKYKNKQAASPSEMMLLYYRGLPREGRTEYLERFSKFFENAQYD